MRVPAFSFARKLLLAAAVGLLACGLALPCAPAFAEGDAAPPALLASSLTDGSASFVREDVSLATFEDDAAPEPIIGSFTADGLTYAVRSGEAVALVAVDATSPLIEKDDEDGFLQVPASVSFGGFDYAVSAVGRYAFYLSGVTDVMLPASVIDVDDRAFRSSDVASVEVAEGSSTYSSFDGALYDADQSSLLLIPEGKQGTVLLCKTTASAAPSVFSHCSLVTQVAVEEGSAAFASENGLLYDASLETLLRVPAGATEIVIRDGCTSVVAGSMEGCTKLESIEAPASVTEVHEPFLSSGAEASLQAGGVVALSLSDQPDASDKQGADSAAEALASAVSVTLPASAEVGPWKQAGFWIEASQSDGQPEMLSEDVPLSTGVDEPVGPIASTQSAATANATTREIPYRVFGPNRLYVSIEPSGTKYPYVYKESYYSLDYEDYSDTLFNGRTGYSQAFTFSSNDSDVWTTTWLSQTHFPDDVAFQKTTPTINGVTASAQKDYLHLYIQKRSDATQAHCWIGTSGSTKSGALFPYGVTRVRVVERGAGAKWTPDNLTITDTTSPQKVSLKSDTATVRIFLNGCMQSKVTWKKSASDSTAYTTTLVDPYGTPSVPTTPTLSGYTFAGWEDASGNLVASSTATKTNTSVFGDVTYIARWTKKASLSVTLNKNATDATAGTSTAYYWPDKGYTTSSSSTSVISSGSKLVSSLPTRPGYNFAGYYSTSSSSGGTQYVDASGNLTSSAPALTSSTTWYARWVSKGGYSITLDANGGSPSSAFVYYWMEKGYISTFSSTTVVQPGSILVSSLPTCSGYTFQGYYSTNASSGGTQYVDSSGRLTSGAPALTSNTTWYARWAKKASLTITLDKNATDATAGTSAVYYWPDKGYTTSSSSTSVISSGSKLVSSLPTRTGYTFGGYVDSITSSNFSQCVDSSGNLTSSAPALTSNTTWYAIWTKKTSSTVTLDKNATDATAGTSAVYYWSDKGYTTSSSSTSVIAPGSKLVSSLPTRSGYDFAGYYSTSSSSGGTQYVDASGNLTSSAPALTSNTTWYARWAKKASLTITLDKNATDATAGTSAAYYWPDKGYTTSSSSTSVIAPGSKLVSSLPTRSGYDFAGFYSTNASSGGAQYIDASGNLTSSAPGLASGITWYARWTKKASLTVTLDKNATDATAGTDAVYYWPGKGYTTSSSSTSVIAPGSKLVSSLPTWAGYTFAGFYSTNTSSDGTQYVDASGNLTSNAPALSSGATWYARWTAKPITLTWDSNGGSNVASTTQTYSSTAKVSLPAANPTRTGYTFAGWWTAATGGVQVTSSTALPTANTTYHAHWSLNPYSIAYELDGGSVSGNPTTYDVTTTTFTLKNPTRTGYAFTGWSGTGLSGDANKTVTIAKGSTGDRSYTAHWVKNAIYAVTLDPQQGTGGTAVIYQWTGKGFYAEPNPDDGSQPIGSIVAPSRAGYVYGGYYAAPEGQGGQLIAGTSLAGLSSSSFSGTATLFADWKRIPSHKVALDANGGAPDMAAWYWPERGYTAEEASTDVVGAGSTLVASLPQRPGFVFQGYYDAAEGGVQMVDARGRLTAEAPRVEHPVTYIAHWAPSISVDVPIAVTAEVDLLGIEDQVPASGYIESRCGAPLAVEEVSFTALAGAADLFGEANTASVSLEALALAGDASWAASAPIFSFPLSADATESDASKLAALRMEAYEDHIPIAYRFAIPEDVLASIDVGRFSGKETAVGKVVYTVNTVKQAG